jgi:hypothetical protein
MVTVAGVFAGKSSATRGVNGSKTVIANCANFARFPPAQALNTP